MTIAQPIFYTVLKEKCIKITAYVSEIKTILNPSLHPASFLANRRIFHSSLIFVVFVIFVIWKQPVMGTIMLVSNGMVQVRKVSAFLVQVVLLL